MAITTIHLVSHSHWDREWYLTFQQFRLKLVSMIDSLLDLLAADSNYCSFTLDGQTILLDDYLEIRPEREAEIRSLVQSGRLLIGPWYILPDEFLVSPEAIIRNLLQGDRTARRFGPKMMIGYIPDPFGHIGQMPQILRGFGIGEACVQRGLGDEPCEFWWQSPDGSRVLMLYLRERYSNASRLTCSEPVQFVEQVKVLRDRLLPFTETDQVLLMHGDDHTRPDPNTGQAVEFANHNLEGDQLFHSTLPRYTAAVTAEIGSRQLVLPTVKGELRSSKRYHLLPGVLSTRVWIKQRNHACETLLEKWAEPFSAFARQVEAAFPETMGRSSPVPRLRKVDLILQHAWRLLLECHPHDSICGCSIDQVHDEMRPRFDQVEQIGEEVTRQSLESLTDFIHTAPPTNHPAFTPISAVVVFNPNGIPCSGTTRFNLPLPVGTSSLHILDDSGNRILCEIGKTRLDKLIDLQLDRAGFLELLRHVDKGTVSSLAENPHTITDLQIKRAGNSLFLDALLQENIQPDANQIEQIARSLAEAMIDEEIQRFFVVASRWITEVECVAVQVPPFGYKTLWVSSQAAPVAEQNRKETSFIENDFFRLEISAQDGTASLIDKTTGASFHGLNQFIDGGDCGDEYNYCPPENDLLVKAQLVEVEVKRSATRQTLKVHLTLPAPSRSERLAEQVPLDILTWLTLVPGAARVDIHTEVENTASDHRLRVHFPAPFAVSHADFDGHFEVVRRPTALPEYDPTWGEQPRQEQPQRNFCAIHSGQTGLMVANQGIREVEATSQGNTSEIRLTLLRCVGWLSRGDLTTRKGYAGPELPTPGAQMPGRHAFDYAIIPYAGEGAQLAAIQEAFAFNAPMRSQPATLHPGPLPTSLSFVQVNPQGFSISAIKEAAPGGLAQETSWLVRGYNLTGLPVDVHLSPWLPPRSAVQTNLAEEELKPLEIDADGGIDTKVRSGEVFTVKFTGFRNQKP